MDNIKMELRNISNEDVIYTGVWKCHWRCWFLNQHCAFKRSLTYSFVSWVQEWT